MVLLSYLIIGNLCEIDLETAKQLCKMGKIVIPGQKLCPKCREQFWNQLQNQDDEPHVYKLSIENKQDSESENADYNQIFIVWNTRETLNATLGEFELSPLKVHSLPKCLKIIHGKRNL